jgi:predicted transcriptional regulator
VILVEDVMSRTVFTIAAGTSIVEAARALFDRDLGGAPVCASDGHVLGVVSARELVDPLSSDDAAEARRAVEAVLSPEVFAIAPRAPLNEAIRTMAFEGIHQLIVFDQDGGLAGVLTCSDVLRALAGIGRKDERVVAIAPPEHGGQ